MNEADELDENEETLRAATVGYAVLFESEINPVFAKQFVGILNVQLLDAELREEVGLPPLERGAVLAFKAPEE